MSIVVYSGLPGSGKSLRLAKIALELLERNLKYFKKSGTKRILASNLKFSTYIEKRYEGFILYWEDPAQIVKLKDADIIWDEMSTYLDSTQWEIVPLEMKRWIQQHRKFGIEIYGTAQDFPTIVVSFRRVTSQLFIMRKLLGSRDKTATRPAVKKPWGVILMREVLRDDFGKEKEDYRYVGTDWFFITKELVSTYDTQQELRVGEYPPLRHIERKCANEDCTFCKVLHI